MSNNNNKNNKAKSFDNKNNKKLLSSVTVGYEPTPEDMKQDAS